MSIRCFNNVIFFHASQQSNSGNVAVCVFSYMRLTLALTTEQALAKQWKKKNRARERKHKDVVPLNLNMYLLNMNQQTKKQWSMIYSKIMFKHRSRKLRSLQTSLSSRNCITNFHWSIYLFSVAYSMSGCSGSRLNKVVWMSFSKQNFQASPGGCTRHSQARWDTVVSPACPLTPNCSTIFPKNHGLRLRGAYSHPSWFTQTT